MRKLHEGFTTKFKAELNEQQETLAMEGPNKFKSVQYKPTCRHGCTDCIHDPAYILVTYPHWYLNLYGKVTPEQASTDPNGCALCKDGEMYDDEDK